MYRLLNWSVGTAAVLALAMIAFSRSEKLLKPTTESSARDNAMPETGGMAPSATSSSVTPSGSSSFSTPPVGATAPASAKPAAPTQFGEPVGSAERTFIAEAAANGLAEIDASRMMAARSADPGVKSYARQLEREHLSTNDKLKRIAEGKGIALPVIASKETKDLLDRLRGLPAVEGDQAFVREFGIETHNKAIMLFEKEAKEGQDPQLRAFAEQTLPRLREHLTMAQQLQSKVTTH